MAVNTGMTGGCGTTLMSSAEEQAMFGTESCSGKQSLNHGGFGSETKYSETLCMSGSDDSSAFYFGMNMAQSSGVTSMISMSGGHAVQANNSRTRTISTDSVPMLSFPTGCSNPPTGNTGSTAAPSSAKANTGGAGAKCSVCGDEASGFHYGVDSCEGCKGFFRRCIIQGLTQQCANSEKCEITPLTRNSCQFCRLKKCFAVGMSRGASRLGRRPKRLKAHYGVEAKIQLPAKPITIAPQPGPSFASKIPLSMAELETLLEKLNSQNRYNIKLPSLLAALNSLVDDGGRMATVSAIGDERLNDGGGQVSLSPGLRSSDSGMKQLTISARQLSPDTTGSDAALTTAVDASQAQSIDAIARQIRAEAGFTTQSSSSEFRNGTTRESQPKSNSHIANTNDARALVGTVYHQLREAEQRRKMLGEPVKPSAAIAPSAAGGSLVEAVVAPPPVTETIRESFGGGDSEAIKQSLAELVDEARRLPAPGSERALLVEQVIISVIDAHMNTCNYTKPKIEVGLARYLELQHGKGATNDDVDPLKVWSAFVANMAPVIQRVVSFSKSLPGFTELCQDDQIKLIKQGSFEVILARYLPLFTKKGMFVPDMSVRVSLHVIKMMPLGDFFCEQYKFADYVNQLEMCDGEIGLLTAIMIINPDRSGIANRRAVYKLRGLLLQSLYVYMKSIRPDMADDRIERTVDILVRSDQINKMHSCALNNMRLSSPDFKLPELHMEVYDGLP